MPGMARALREEIGSLPDEGARSMTWIEKLAEADPDFHAGMMAIVEDWEGKHGIETKRLTRRKFSTATALYEWLLPKLEHVGMPCSISTFERFMKQRAKESQ